ncbi:MAG TPA: hypothetical protein PK760_11240, partial [Flavobacteriales bacterium]|nr:hypothetical protein [Flavobacteriales bacterium]
MRWLLLLCILAAGQRLRAQDIIVPLQGDTIFCEINIVRTDRIHYTVREGSSISRSIIKMSDVRSYERSGYRPVQMGPGGRPAKHAANERPQDVRPKVPVVDPIRLALHAGYANALGMMPDAPPGWSAHIEEMTTGTAIGTDLTVFATEAFGLGFQYDATRFDHRSEGVEFIDANGDTVLKPIS